MSNGTDANLTSTWQVVDIPDSEVLLRRSRAIAEFTKHGCDTMIFFAPRSVHYLVGAELMTTERPEALILRADGRAYMMVPLVEVGGVEDIVRFIDEIRVYPDYPGTIHPMHRLTEMLKDLGITGNVAADSDGYGAIWGYRGPKISELNPSIHFTFLPYMIEDLQVIKTPFDIAVMKETARWGTLTHTLLKEYTCPERTELEIVTQVNLEATTVMRKTMSQFSERYSPPTCRAMFGGQIGVNSQNPHSRVFLGPIHEGDHVVTGATGDMLGYWTELERTMFVGEPTKEQEKYYNHAVALHNLGVSMLKPGNTCADVDREVKRYYKENGLEDCWRHHTGHGLGFLKGGDAHELPFLDEGMDDVVLQPGMCFSCEPGVFVKGLGGFRVSDTIHITETGNEVLTYWPKDIESVICWRRR